MKVFKLRESKMLHKYIFWDPHKMGTWEEYDIDLQFDFHSE